MTKQKMDADWLDFHSDPKTPYFVLPSGAVDAHCHVLVRHRNSLLRLSGNTHPATQVRKTCLPCATILGFRAMSLYRRHAMARITAR